MAEPVMCSTECTPALPESERRPVFQAPWQSDMPASSRNAMIIMHGNQDYPLWHLVQSTPTSQTRAGTDWLRGAPRPNPETLSHCVSRDRPPIQGVNARSLEDKYYFKI